MTHDSERDWAALNAYADGELEATRTAQIEARLSQEPALRYELARIRGLKRRLVQLQPTEQESAEPSRNAQFVSKPLRAAIAAGIAIIFAAGIAGFLHFRSDDPAWFTAAISMHERLSQSAYVVEQQSIERLVSSGHALEFRAPDLSGSRLFLVDVITSRNGDDEEIGIHYRGLRGCRLTVAAIHDAREFSQPSVSNALIRVWLYGGFKFAVIATRMDPNRFASVADYAKAAIEDDDRRRSNLRLAMAESYSRARPCA